MADLESLERYRWSGHSVLLGHQGMAGQEMDEVLLRFGKDRTTALNGYRQFVADGTAAGRREDLIGGGLKRNLIGQEESSGRTAYDERILGSGEFVESLTHDDNLSESLKLQLPLAELRQRVCDVTGIKAEKLQRPGKERGVARARALFCYLAIQEFGYHGKGTGLMVNLGPAGVCNAVRRGELLLETDPALREKIVGV